MTEKSDEDTQDGSDKIRIYSNNEERIKSLGSVLANDANRSIFLLLVQEEMAASGIADRTGMSLSLVIHHLEKMQDAGLARVSRVSKNTRNQDMKHYRAIPAILILPEEARGRAKDSKALASSLKRVLRFSAIGIAGLSAWLTTKYSWFSNTMPRPIPEPDIVPPDSIPSAPIIHVPSEPLVPIVVGLAVITLGLIVDRILAAMKK